MYESIAQLSAAVGYGAGAYLMFRGSLALLRVRWARNAYPQVECSDSPNAWQLRCRGALLGLAIGDALNLPAESLPRWLTRLRYPGEPRMRRGLVRFSRRHGDVSDDTQLTICVARSISPDGTYSHERFLAELGRWSYFRIGAGGACAAAAVGARWRHDVVSPGSEGNGVAIRVAPLAIAAVQGSDQELIALVAENGRATHSSDAALRAAFFIALLIKRGLKAAPGALGDRSRLREVLRSASELADFKLCLPSDQTLDDEAAFRAKLWEQGTSGHVHQSVRSVGLILLRHGLDYSAAMQTIFRAGGDTDSIGAMVGAFIGAQVAAEGIPRQQAPVQHHDYLCHLADRLASPQHAPERAGEVVCVSGDVTQRPVEVVVNAWNRNAIPPWLLVPQGVSKALRKAGGGETLSIMGRQAPLPLGAAVETAAPGMQCRWVIHVAGIDLLWRASEASVRQATRDALSLAHWLGARNVALPLIGAGSGSLSQQLAQQIILDELQIHHAHFDRLELVVRG